MNIISDSDSSIWTKHNNNLFDVTMGSVMCVEVCDLIGLFINHDLQQVLLTDSYGLYRDDGLGILYNFSKCDQERISKKLEKFQNTRF